jgi:hypothetical protein
VSGNSEVQRNIVDLARLSAELKVETDTIEFFKKRALEQQLAIVDEELEAGNLTIIMSYFKFKLILCFFKFNQRRTRILKRKFL